MHQGYVWSLSSILSGLLAPSKASRLLPHGTMLQCILMRAVRHGLYFGMHPDRCMLPGLVPEISISWVAAGLQALRSPADLSIELEVVYRGRHAVSQ